MGRSKDRGGAICRTLSEEARCHAGEPHLQVRLSGCPVHLLMEREVRLPIPFALGWRPAKIRRTDETDAAMAGRGEGQQYQEGVYHLSLSGVLPRWPRPHTSA